MDTEPVVAEGIRKNKNMRNIQGALANIPLANIYSYYFENAVLKLPNDTIESNDTVKIEELKKILFQQYLELQTIYNEIFDLICKDFLGVSDLSNLTPDQQEMIQNINMIFNSGYNPDFQTIKRLKKAIIQFENMTSVELKEKLIALKIFQQHDEIFSIKNIFIQRFKEYFANAAVHLTEMQKLVPELTSDDVDNYSTQIEELRLDKQYQYHKRIMIEYMRTYILYPQHRVSMLENILSYRNPMPIFKGEKEYSVNEHLFIMPNQVGETKEIRLLDIIEAIKEEGVLPKHVRRVLTLFSEANAENIELKPQSEIQGQNDPSVNTRQEPQGQEKQKEKDRVDPDSEKGLVDVAIERSLDNALGFFSTIDKILQEYLYESREPKYEKSSNKQLAVDKVEIIFGYLKTVDELNMAFMILEPYINRHKNYRFDSFFGNANTSSWKNVMKRLRESALNALLKEVDVIINNDEKMARLREACNMPLFNRHRNNHWYTGKFGDTQAVGTIKNKIAELAKPKQLQQISL